MKQKILAFITDGKKFLALRNNPIHPELHGGDFWFTVTGGVKKNETKEQTVVREIKEETGLNVKDVFDLNWASVYENWEGECGEFNFIAFVNPKQKIKLDNEEVINFDWLILEEFVEVIRWNDDKDLLKKVLEKGLNKKSYFKKLEIADYK